MAHHLAFKPAGVILSCMLNRLWGVFVDGDFVDIRLVAPGGVVLLSERFYAFDGTVYLYELGLLVESFLRSAGYQFANFTLSLLNEDGSVADSCIIMALYCDRYTLCADSDRFLYENFLTTLPTRRIPPATDITLSYFAASGESTDAVVSYRCASPLVSSGTVVDSFSVEGEELNAVGVQQLVFSQSSILEDVNAKRGISMNSVEILEFTVAVGQRSVSFVVDRTLSAEDYFLFRNCFNVWDVAHIPHSTTAKTDVERSLAVINLQSQFYNQRVTKSYEVESGPLSFGEASWIDQLFTAHEVMRPVLNECDDSNEYVLQPVLITDSTCDISDGDEKPNTVKFTWRFADNRPNVRLSSSPGIFTSPYNIVFS